jgi:hypothetical protein
MCRDRSGEEVVGPVSFPRECVCWFEMRRLVGIVTGNWLTSV